VRGVSERHGEPYELPSDPDLHTVARALRDGGFWGYVVDERWNLLYVSDDLRITFGGGMMVDFLIGQFMWNEASVTNTFDFRMGTNSLEHAQFQLRHVGGFVLQDTPGGKEELKAKVHPELRGVVDDLVASDVAANFFLGAGMALTDNVGVPEMLMRIRRSDGSLAGTMMVSKPAAGAAILGAMTSLGDLRHFERMQRVAKASRRTAAILFADLEGSSQLSRRLSTANYFSLGRRLVTAADHCVIEAGGLVGRHVGDGVGAFFLTETSGSESAAARACVEAARNLRAAVANVAERSGLDPGEVSLRFGLHWGSTLYVGQIATGGRTEVTALGDQVNEAARIEACATGGRALASKELIERLDASDASDLGIDPQKMLYTPLSDLSTATEKARRDAPAIAVCEV
jgi:class 3 adenylate cyclase